MVVINLAFTAPVNPQGSDTVVTRAQLWSGFQHKVRDPLPFIPAMAECKIVGDRENVVERDIVFKEGMGPPGAVREVCTSYEPSRVDFAQPNGSLISNIISVGAGGDTDLYVTFAFAWQHPEISAGSNEEKTERSKHETIAQKAVEMTIQSIRKLAKEGKF